ncbi:MAG: PASTA domain-containing protein [Bacteroidaceae bacterium]|nr:PASTA domain-containing protein [Bacteroidaceae bacterium]
MDFRKKILAPVVWGNLLGMFVFVVLMVAGVWYGTMIYTHHGEIIQVPDVTKIHHSDAAVMLEQYGLAAEVSDSGYNRNLATGSVLMQHPKAGTKVKSGRKIYLTINSNSSPTLTMPNIADNCDVYEAEIRLRAMGFKIGPKEYVEGDKDWVIGVKCRGAMVNAGDKVPAEAPIVLMVGNSLTEDEQWTKDLTDSIGGTEDAYEFEPETEW